MSLSPSTQLTFSCNCGAVCDLPGNLNAFRINRSLQCYDVLTPSGLEFSLLAKCLCFFVFSFCSFSLSQLPKLLTSFISSLLPSQFLIQQQGYFSAQLSSH